MLEALARARFDRDVAAIDRRVAEMRGWTILADQFPVLDILFAREGVRPLRLRFTCLDYDELPPLIDVLEVDGRFVGQMPSDPRSIFNNGINPSTGRKFVCMRGSRCYHQQHAPDAWENYRGRPEVMLGELANQLWRVWQGIAR